MGGRLRLALLCPCAYLRAPGASRGAGPYRCLTHPPPRLSRRPACTPVSHPIRHRFLLPAGSAWFMPKLQQAFKDGINFTNYSQ